MEWFRLDSNFYNHPKIKGIEASDDKNGFFYSLIWIKLLALASKCDDEGCIYMSKNVPFTLKTLAQEFNIFDKKNTKKLQNCIEMFEKLSMIYKKDEFIFVKNWSLYQHIEEREKRKIQGKIRQKRFREEISLKNSNALRNAKVTHVATRYDSVTQNGGLEPKIDETGSLSSYPTSLKDLEYKDKDKDKEEKKVIEVKKKKFSEIFETKIDEKNTATTTTTEKDFILPNSSGIDEVEDSDDFRYLEDQLAYLIRELDLENKPMKTLNEINARELWNWMQTYPTEFIANQIKELNFKAKEKRSMVYLRAMLKGNFEKYKEEKEKARKIEEAKNQPEETMEDLLAELKTYRTDAEKEREEAKNAKNKGI